MTDSNLVTTCTFHGQEYLFKMNILNNNLEILITDKNTGEEWQCSYDAIYIENLTQKTGNFKQFNIFVAMIKSGLLRTSECVNLDLLTFEDLELLRSRKITKSVGSVNNNRRYLILTYIVEFDKIRYPLPLDYCGPPDPLILQATIRRLETELMKTKEELSIVKNNDNETNKIKLLEKRIEELTEENQQYQNDINELTKYIDKNQTKPIEIQSLQRAVMDLEKSFTNERQSHNELIEKLQNDNKQLTETLEHVKYTESALRQNLSSILNQKLTRNKNVAGDINTSMSYISNHSIRTMYRRPSTAITVTDGCLMVSHENLKSPIKQSSLNLNHSATSASSENSNKYQNIPKNSMNRNKASRNTPENNSFINPRPTTRQSKKRTKSIDYKKLEAQIENLQKMLNSSI